jgi:translation elongation factor EF-G
MSAIKPLRMTAIGSAEVKHAQRGRFLYAFVVLQIALVDEPTNRIEYKLSVPEELDEYHLQALRATDISEVKIALEQGVVLGLEKGGIKGFHLANCKVTILQVIRSIGESSTVALTAATAKAVWNALEKCVCQDSGKEKDFHSPKFKSLWIDFDETTNRWNLHL